MAAKLVFGWARRLRPLACVGVAVGTFTVAITGYADAAGELGAASWLIAGNALGALPGGVLYTAMPVPQREDRRLRRGKRRRLGTRRNPGASRLPPPRSSPLPSAPRSRCASPHRHTRCTCRRTHIERCYRGAPLASA
ncbi:hypothetical protein GCM10027187_64360 [Streptosporangium sandarakinum]